MNDFNLKQDILEGHTSREIYIIDEPRLYATQPSTSTKVYKTDFLLINSINFPEKIYYEDYEHHFFTLNSARKVALFNSTLFYASIERLGQITAKAGNARLDSYVVISRLLSGVLTDLSPQAIRYASQSILDFMHWNLLEAKPKVREKLISLYFSDMKINNFLLHVRKFQKDISLPGTLNLPMMQWKYRSALNDYYSKRPSWTLFRVMIYLKLATRLKNLIGKSNA
jgi:hypothetical protein